MAQEQKLLDLTKGEGGYKVNNPNIGPEVKFHGQRVDLTKVTERKAAEMAADKQFRLVTKVASKEGAAAASSASDKKTA